MKSLMRRVVMRFPFGISNLRSLYMNMPNLSSRVKLWNEKRRADSGSPQSFVVFTIQFFDILCKADIDFIGGEMDVQQVSDIKIQNFDDSF